MDIFFSRSNTAMSAILLLIGVLLSSTALDFTDAQSVGVCYGGNGNNLPTKQGVVDLYKSKGINKIRLYYPDEGALQALRGSNIEVILGVPNNNLGSLTNAGAANDWVNKYVKPYSNVKIKYIAVGNEIHPGSAESGSVLPAMQNIQRAISSANLQGQIKVSTAIDTTLLGNSYPPRDGVFSNSASQYIRPIVNFLVSNGAPLLANVYPYFSYVNNQQSIGLDYALFTKQGANEVGYQNLFDAILDSLYAALEKIGGPNVKVVVSESGWPSEGGAGASVQNAGTYYQNLIKHAKGGTPKRPNGPIETYLFAMFDENLHKLISMETSTQLGSTAHPSSAPAPVRPFASDGTMGRHLARRLVEIGVRDVFSVPGDFNLTLLDHLIAEPQLNLVGCCNELNAGYAADGYARAKGVGACVVTFTVGGLSILNAIAGAYSENLPVICIVGGPNSNDYGTNRILHHTIGLPDFSQELRCFQTITCFQAVVSNLEDAHELIDTAISTALKESKPVYISISCNLPGIPHPSFARDPVPFSLAPKVSNQEGLEAAVEAAAEFLNKAVKPVIVGGPKLRVAKAQKAFLEFAEASGYPIAVMPSGKGLVPENHPHFIGTYWGAVSTGYCGEIVESADAYVFVGPIFNDYSSVGYSLLIKKDKAIIVQPNRVTIGNGPSLGWVFTTDFLTALSKKVKTNTTAMENYRRIYVPPGIPLKREKDEPLRVNVLFKHIQELLSRDTAVIAETGDSWFNCQKLRLPENCGYEFQMQYGSIGWSVGATLGYAQAASDKRVIACIGDGSFQVTAQDISTMIRCGQRSIIFLINNGGYTIEVEIHDGPYNVIKNWDYTRFVDAIHNGEGKCWTSKVRTEDELTEAIARAMGEEKDSLCFIEVFVHKDDTSKELLEWGSRVAAANSRPPNPQ